MDDSKNSHSQNLHNRVDREARKNNCASLHKDIATLNKSGTECNQLGYKLG